MIQKKTKLQSKTLKQLKETKHRNKKTHTKTWEERQMGKKILILLYIYPPHIHQAQGNLSVELWEEAELPGRCQAQGKRANSTYEGLIWFLV